MKKYKFSRKEVCKKLKEYVWDTYSIRKREILIEMLLATISPEEESQKIMMEQVDKECTEKRNNNGKYTPENINEMKKFWEGDKTELKPKPDKECKHHDRTCDICNFTYPGHQLWCPNSCNYKSTPIKDSKPIKEIKKLNIQCGGQLGWGILELENKVNEIITYLKQEGEIK